MDQLTAIVARVFEISPDSVTDDLSRDRFEQWTSLNHLLLVSEIEAELGIEFTTDEVVNISSFRDLKSIVARKR